MIRFRQLCATAALGVLPSLGCSSHGRPLAGSETLAPNEILDFETLYSQNCSACHGPEGRGGAALALSNPVYLAIAGEAAIRKVVSSGVPGTSMPAFAESSGGMLTDKQIDVITTQIRARWSRPGFLGAANPPSYAAKSAGNVPQGEADYTAFCQSCHGPEGRGGPKGSSITEFRLRCWLRSNGTRV